MKNRRITIILLIITLAVLAASAPASLREAYKRGGFYVFSHDFVTDIPKRLAGPGRFRFVLQPVLAIILGIRGGLTDARLNRPPYLSGVLFSRTHRRELIHTALATIVNLLLMGILMDSLFQWVILGASYPGAALLVGPVLIVTPYVLARAASNRIARMRSAR